MFSKLKALKIKVNLERNSLFKNLLKINKDSQRNFQASISTGILSNFPKQKLF